ncbi:sensor histidine kinase [Amycolatopsis magusensis]|uniref:sensor histidine kinase n=1 Tax=Amycolatopsis magusensis TaxID=882444 RepID=UPI0037AD26BD
MRSAIVSVRRWAEARPLLQDSVLAVVMVVVIAEAGRAGLNASARPESGLGLVLIGVSNLPLALRRRAPLPVLLLCCAGAITYAALGFWNPLNNFGCLFALYTTTVLRPRRISLPSAGLVWAVLSGAAVGAGGRAWWPEVAFAALFCVVAWAPGEVRRTLADRNRQLAALTEQLNRDRAANAQRAVMEERIRIARELHDVVAHHMSVISVQAGLARYVLGSDQAAASAALHTVSEVAGQALQELRLLLNLLRVEPGEPHDPESPGLGGLPALVQRVSLSGVPTTMVVTGTPWPLTHGAQLCVYRVVQESLTNTVRHAGAERAELVLTFEPDRLVVRVTDDGHDTGGGSAGAGQGLIGMRERAKLYAGSLVAGPRSPNGFEVVLTLPVSSATRAGQHG